MPVTTVQRLLTPAANAPAMTVSETPSQRPDVTPKRKAITSTPSPATSRLLYRGALSLPDSLLLLDGLTFTAHLDTLSLKDGHNLSASKTKLDLNLLQSPIALALESMRGRPSLRLLGTVRMKDIHLDETGGVEMDVHPMAVISRIYFENIFCLMPFPGASPSGDSQRSDIGVKVALGDSDGPETTEIVIFSQLIPSLGQDKVRLRVARLFQRQQSVHPQRRLPRPDDPIPRKPPAFFIREQPLKTGRVTGLGDRKDLKRTGSTSTIGVGPSKRAKLVSVDSHAKDSDVFKIPMLPGTAQSSTSNGTIPRTKAKEKDVFGEVSEVGKVQNHKGKQKADTQLSVDDNTLEKANKNVIKRATIEYLEKTKDPTGRCIDKEHADFKELYNFIQRGVAFALRSKMRTCTLDLRVVDRLIDMHALMYLGGCGGSAQMLWRVS